MKIKDFFPPILVQKIKRYKERREAKEYQNYSQALNVCTQAAYQNAELCNMIADKTIIHIEFLKNKPFHLNAATVFFLAAVNQYVNIYSKKGLVILDFGGACGHHYFETRRFVSKNLTLRWYVVETPKMVESAVEKGLGSDEVIFVNDIKEIKEKIDIVHSSGALQYVSHPHEFLNGLINIKAKWMFFNRMMFNENDRDFITIQKSYLSSNGPGNLPPGYADRIVSYPHTTLSFPKFNSTIINNGYELEWIFEDASGSYQIKNEKISGKGLLYIKKQ